MSASSVSSVGRTDLSEILQRIKSGGGGRGGAPGQVGEPPAEVRAQFESAFKSAAEELGIDTSSFAKVGGQIKDAVSSVIQENQGASPEDLQKAIGGRVDGVLKDNGIDPAEFKKQFEQIGDKLGLPRPGEGGFPPGGFSAGGAQGSGYSAANSDQQLLQQLLQSLQSDDTDISNFFSNAPAGTFVDQTV